MSDAFRVVVIDDDPDLRQLIELTLRFTAGWEVTSASDGASGIEAVEREQPDVAVVDLMMPGMDGYEVCRRLKAAEATAGIPLVILTAHKELDRDRMDELALAGVVYKPFEPEELADRIRALVGGSDG